MHVRGWDGESGVEELTDLSLEKALAGPNTKSVQVFQPGKEVTRSNGRRYRMNGTGQWVRVGKEKK